MDLKFGQKPSVQPSLDQDKKKLEALQEEDQKEESLHGHSPKQQEVSDLMKSVKAEQLQDAIYDNINQKIIENIDNDRNIKIPEKVEVLSPKEYRERVEQGIVNPEV